jgi:hypothetical protein
MVSLSATLTASLDSDSRVRLGYFKGAIVRPVVDYNQLDIPIVLLPNASQAALDGTFRIAGWNDNGNEGQLNPP